MKNLEIFLGDKMAQLIEPDGTLNIVVTVEYAIEYCSNNPGWSWMLV